MAIVGRQTEGAMPVRLGPDDLAGRERLARYPFSLQRMIRVTDGAQVLYVAEKPGGLGTRLAPLTRVTSISCRSTTGR